MAVRPLNYTTKVPASQTVGEVTAMLAAAGASAVGTTYEGGRPTGLNFLLPTAGGVYPFALPVRVDAVQRYLAAAERAGEFASSRKARGTYTTREHAERVAWRVVKDWLEAQLAMVAAELATLDEVMLPYRQIDGRSLCQLVTEQILALPGVSPA